MPALPRGWHWLLITAIAPVAWGSNYYVTRQFLPLDHPLWGAVLRALPAGLLLLAVSRSRPRGSWWWKSVVLGTLNVGAFFVLVYVASQLLPSSVASTIMATSAAVLMLVAWPLLRDRPTLLPLLGALLGFVGVGTMVLGGTTAIEPAGVLASLAAMVMSSFGFVLTKKWAVGEKTLAITSWQLIAGGLLVLPFALVIEGGPPVIDGTAALAFGYVTVVATALAFVAWFTGLRHLPAGTVGLVGLLNPVTGVLLGTLLAAEPFGPREAIGTALVVGGVLLGVPRGAPGRRRSVREDRRRERRSHAADGRRPEDRAV
ncbi:EamA family transporter [Subtercola boreus]|uniref:EamA family transporter n=2 Tax=Subtercola boreus TaxID=120213 RepID=A0A3E0VLC5_9MICO|nr:EamA family transporter [Subtercola boreus]RFA10449.1 EamA family transporter [Subtercola boreus]TQL56022.1 putative blue pigment (indigoidine) exporter [Subtercola boreus]